MSILISRRSLAAAALAAAVLLSALGAQRAAASDDPALTFIQGLGDQAISVLKDKANTTFEEREAAFREVMVEGFDIPIVSRFVLGRHWKTASKEQRKEYRRSSSTSSCAYTPAASILTVASCLRHAR